MGATTPLKNHRDVRWRQVIEGRLVLYEVTVDGEVVYKTDKAKRAQKKFEDIAINEGQLGTYENGEPRYPNL